MFFLQNHVLIAPVGLTQIILRSIYNGERRVGHHSARRYRGAFISSARRAKSPTHPRSLATLSYCRSMAQNAPLIQTLKAALFPEIGNKRSLMVRRFLFGKLNAVLVVVAGAIQPEHLVRLVRRNTIVQRKLGQRAEYLIIRSVGAKMALAKDVLDVIIRLGKVRPPQLFQRVTGKGKAHPENFERNRMYQALAAFNVCVRFCYIG